MYDICPAIMDIYSEIKRIGEGSYGTVYKAIDSRTGKLVALKKIRADHQVEGIPSTTLREIATLKTLHHPNIVQLDDIVPTNHGIYLVFEYMPMDLKKLLDFRKKATPLPESQVKSYLWQLLQALAYCHRHGVLHRDLKPNNLLIDTKGYIKLADFGLARPCNFPLRPYTHEVITLWYRAPEILMGVKEYHMAVDIWSLGCIAAELSNNRCLFAGDSEIDQLFKIFQQLGTPTEANWPGVSELQEFKPTFPQWEYRNLENRLIYMEVQGRRLIASMLRLNPERRVTALEALRDPYFDNVKIEPLSHYPCDAIDADPYTYVSPKSSSWSSFSD